MNKTINVTVYFGGVIKESGGKKDIVLNKIICMNVDKQNPSYYEIWFVNNEYIMVTQSDYELIKTALNN